MDNDVQQEVPAADGLWRHDESALKMGVKQPHPANPALRNQNVQVNSII